jgi:hypothetical protein
MSYKLLFILNAIVALALGLAFLFVPVMVLDYFGVDKYASSLLLARFFGSAMVALGLVLWFAKDAVEGNVHKGIGVGLLVSAVIGVVVNVIGVASSVIRANGWITIIVYVLFALLYGFMIFLQPRMKQ